MYSIKLYGFARNIRAYACPKAEISKSIGLVVKKLVYTQEVLKSHISIKRINKFFFSKNKMKPLEKGRRALYWIGVHFTDDDVPVSQQQMMTQKSFACTFAIIFIGMVTFHVIAFFKFQFTNAEEFFSLLLQFVLTAHVFSSYITINSCRSRISTVFQLLTNIYEKCKAKLDY